VIIRKSEAEIDGMARAGEVIDDGAATGVLAELVRVSQAAATA